MLVLRSEEYSPWAKPVEIYTIQMGQYRKLENTGIELIDVTIKSKNPQYHKLFAPPSWDMVNGIKNGTMSPEEYTDIYVNKLHYTSGEYLDEWLSVLDKGKIAISCFCGTECFCHRHICAQYLLEVAEEYGYDAYLLGEFT